MEVERRLHHVEQKQHLLRSQPSVPIVRTQRECTSRQIEIAEPLAQQMPVTVVPHNHSPTNTTNSVAREQSRANSPAAALPSPGSETSKLPRSAGSLRH